jgi:hypothetical protein
MRFGDLELDGAPAFLPDSRQASLALGVLGPKVLGDERKEVW